MKEVQSVQLIKWLTIGVKWLTILSQLQVVPRLSCLLCVAVILRHGTTGLHCAKEGNVTPSQNGNRVILL